MPTLHTLWTVFVPILVALAVPAQEKAAPAAEKKRDATAEDLATAIESLPEEARQAQYALQKADYIGADGTLKRDSTRTKDELAEPKQLDCTTFSSPVLHALVRGSLAGFEPTKVNGFGDQVAEFYGLSAALSSPTKDLIKNIVDATWREAKAGVYYFDLRIPTDGHVGFLVITKDGATATHFSGGKTETKPNGGLATQDAAAFATYIEKSRYKPDAKGTITLYRIVVPDKPTPPGK